MKLLAVSERDEHKSRICCTETGNPGGDVAIGAIERHTVTCSELSSFAKIAPMLSRRRAGLIGATVMIVR